LIVGLVLGLSVGTVAAAPLRETLISIVSWPSNMNVTLTNAPPADTDGDTVPDSLDEFPDNPLWHLVAFSADVTLDSSQPVYDLPWLQSGVKEVRITVFQEATSLRVVYVGFGNGCSSPYDISFSQFADGLLPYRVSGACYGGGPVTEVVYTLDSLRLTQPGEVAHFMLEALV